MHAQRSWKLVPEEPDEEDLRDVLCPVHRAAKAAVDALIIRGEFYYDVPGNMLALERLSHAHKLVLSAQLSTQNQEASRTSQSKGME